MVNKRVKNQIGVSNMTLKRSYWRVQLCTWKLINWNSCKNIMSSQICKNDVFPKELGSRTWFLMQLGWVLPKAPLLLVMAFFMSSIAFHHKNVIICNNKLRGSLYNVLVGWVLQINPTRLSRTNTRIKYHNNR
jgi:hypothetical protein